jgi:hypothetical protein
MFSQLGGLWANQAFERGCFNHLSRLLGSPDPRLFWRSPGFGRATPSRSSTRASEAAKGGFNSF